MHGLPPADKLFQLNLLLLVPISNSRKRLMGYPLVKPEDATKGTQPVGVLRSNQMYDCIFPPFPPRVFLLRFSPFFMVFSRFISSRTTFRSRFTACDIHLTVFVFHRCNPSVSVSRSVKHDKSFDNPRAN